MESVSPNHDCDDSIALSGSFHTRCGRQCLIHHRIKWSTCIGAIFDDAFGHFEIHIVKHHCVEFRVHSVYVSKPQVPRNDVLRCGSQNARKHHRKLLRCTPVMLSGDVLTLYQITRTNQIQLKTSSYNYGLIKKLFSRNQQLACSFTYIYMHFESTHRVRTCGPPLYTKILTTQKNPHPYFVER